MTYIYFLVVFPHTNHKKYGSSVHQGFDVRHDSKIEHNDKYSYAANRTLNNLSPGGDSC